MSEGWSIVNVNAEKTTARVSIETAQRWDVASLRSLAEAAATVSADGDEAGHRHSLPSLSSLPFLSSSCSHLSLSLTTERAGVARRAPESPPDVV